MIEALEAEEHPTGEAMPIVDLVHLAPASNRLRNCIERGHKQGVLPFATVGAYLAAGDDAMLTLQLTLWSFGRRSAAELDRLVSDYVSGRLARVPGLAHPDPVLFPEAGACGTAPDPIGPEGRPVSEESTVDDLTVAGALAGEILSARLEGLLGRSPVASERVGDVLANFPSVMNRLLREQNVGRRTVLELKAKLEAHASRIVEAGCMAPEALTPGGTDAQPDGSAASHDERRALLRSVLGDVGVAEALSGQVLSARLEGMLARTDVAPAPVAEVLADFSATSQRLLSQPNVGRLTVTELKARLHAHASKALGAAGMASEEIERVLQEPVVELEPEPVFEDLAGCCEMLLAQEPPRNADVVRRRYGFDGRVRETLQEIAAEQDCTRERIRQLEAKSLRRFGRLATRLPLTELLRREWTAVWRELTHGLGFLSARDVPAAKSLPPCVELAMDVLKLDAATCLGWVAHRRPHGWTGAPLEEEDVAAAVALVTDTLAKPLPRPLPVGADGSLAACAAAVADLGQAVHGGYLLTARAGARVRRAADAHLALRRRRDGLDLPELAEEVVRATGRPCSVRDLAIVASALPHLFLRVFEDRWAALGPAAPEASTPRRVVHAPGPPAMLPNQGTIARAVADHLDRHGPQRGATMFQVADTILPPGRSAYSIGPVMLGAPELFSRLLPGVWALRWQFPSLETVADDVPRYLRDPFQLRILALSRRACEPGNLYPLWCPEVELALLRWAHGADPGECYRSLLATTDVDGLPTDSREREVWRWRKERDGRFELAEPLSREGYALPLPDRVLAAALAARAHGSCNWMMVNRVCGRRSDSVNGASVVALLLALGAVEAPGGASTDWQRGHAVTAGLDQVITTLGDALHDAGTLSWSAGASARLLDAASDRPRAWVRSDGLSDMLAACRTASASDTPEAGLTHMLEDGEQDDDADHHVQTGLGTERGEQLMRWLLDE